MREQGDVGELDVWSIADITQSTLLDQVGQVGTFSSDSGLGSNNT